MIERAAMMERANRAGVPVDVLAKVLELRARRGFELLAEFRASRRGSRRRFSMKELQLMNEVAQAEAEREAQKLRGCKCCQAHA